ncbi:MAG TPA: lmo0937 family membrane protein [Clostridiaceae bacterium]
MGFLRWLGGIVVFFWLLGFILRIGGGLIHLLIVVAVIIFLVDYVFGRGKH